MDVNQRNATEREYRRILRYGLGLVLVALIVTPVASIELPASYPLFAMLQTATIAAAAVTAFLLLLQARAIGSLPTAVLGAGFAYASATMLPYAFLYPGTFPGFGTALGASPVAYQYLWMLSQIGLVVTLLAYQWLRLGERSDPGARPRGRRAIAGLALAYIVLTPAAIWFGGLPPTIENGHWSPLFIRFMVPLGTLLAGASVVESIRSRSRANALDVWISIVAFAIIIQTYLAVAGVSGFTIGWYASRVVVLFATCAVLGMLLVQAARAYADLIQRAEVLLGEAHTDTLTGLANRRRFDEEFARAFGSAIRRSSPISVAIIDIDHFKDYNDAFGHQAGDEALRSIAEAIAESVERSGDFAARYGGEEFVVILEDTGLDGAFAVAERIRNEVLRVGIPTRNDRTMSVRVGIATRRPGEPVDALLRRADQALYAAKNAGRNRVMSSTTERAVGS